MVIPWQGFPLNLLINKVQPLSDAKYIQFETVYRPEEMPGQRRNVLHGRMLKVFEWMKLCILLLFYQLDYMVMIY